MYQTLLGSYGYDVAVAEDANQALDRLRAPNSAVDAVIVDYDMPGMKGSQLAGELKRTDPELPVIMVSGSRPPEEELGRSVDAVFEKGSSVQTIVDRLESLLAAKKTSHLAKYISLASALAAVALAALLAPKSWK